MKTSVLLGLLTLAVALSFCKIEEPTNTLIDVEKNILLISPVGGEIYFVNDTLNIEWEFNNINSIDVLISYDKMFNWEMVGSSIEASVGHYLFTIPDSVTEECFVKITATEDSTLSSFSNSAFSIIKKDISILCPLGGEIYYIGDTLKIKWESQNVNFVNIHLSIDNGTSWKQLAENIESTIREYSFTLDEIVSAQSLVKISDSDDSTIDDISDSVFTIIEPLDSFFPLAIGNTWVYLVEEKSYTNNWQPKIYRERVSIVGVKTIGQKEYFDFYIIGAGGDETHEYYYFDKSTNIV